jgi:transposase
MIPRLLQLHLSSYHGLIPLGKQAEQESAYRVTGRLQTVVLNSEGRISVDLARIAKVPRSKVSERLVRYRERGVDGLPEGYRSGRPTRLAELQHPCLGDILDPTIPGNS